MSATVVLASKSHIRAALLQRAHVPVTLAAAKVDEEAVRASLTAEGVSPRDQADALAGMKAAKVADKHPGSFVIGCDQVLEFQGEVLGKPDTPEILKAQMTRLSGNQHTLFSAVVVLEGGKPVWRHIGKATLTMHPLSPAYLDDYIARNWNEIRHSVGGYMIEDEGIRLFSKISGSYFDILGLPLPELLSYLVLRKVIAT